MSFGAVADEQLLIVLAFLSDPPGRPLADEELNPTHRQHTELRVAERLSELTSFARLTIRSRRLPAWAMTLPLVCNSCS